MNKKNFWQNWGTTQFEISGLNQNKLLNEIVFKNIKIQKIKTSGTTLFLKVKNCYCNNLIDLLNQKCYTFSVKKQGGISAGLNFIFYRYGLMIGALFSIVAIAFLSCFIFDVSIQNDSANLKQEICSVLKQNNLAIGKIKFGQNTEEIEQCILQNVDSISLVSANFRGMFLCINYTLKTNSKSILQTASKQNIVASSAGVITHISVVSGTPLVRVGQAVIKGQILIAGYKMVDEKKIECVASGTVFANVFKSATVEFCEKQTVFVRTGNFVVENRYTLFDKVIFQNQQENNYQSWQTETTTQNFVFLLPIKITKTTYFQTEQTEIVQDFETSKQTLILQARLLAFEKCESENDILEEKSDTNFVDGKWFVTYTIKIKGKIS